VNIFQTNNSYSNVCQWNSYIFYPCTKRGWWLNKIKEGNPILLLGHPHLLLYEQQIAHFSILLSAVSVIL
ncbi:MAG: hypothetical protein IJA46_01305, partial [Bacteroidaceae bacterium]|nr:hypothetical protein [Bacteroidaceae bacterium]